MMDGPANFRDLGGYTGAGGRVVRVGRVFRSDSLSYMSDADVRHCVDVLGLRTVVDLRAGHEVDEFSHGPLEATGVRFLHRPVLDETRRDRIERDPDAPPREPMSPGAIYLFMLEQYGDRLAAAFGDVADPANHPVVFHCAAGKDRTGLVAALVLGVLGVDDETIVADYVLTESNMPLLVERHRAAAVARGATVEVGDPHFVAEAAAMHSVLDGLRERHARTGPDPRTGVEGFLLDHGLDRAVLDALRAELLG